MTSVNNALGDVKGALLSIDTDLYGERTINEFNPNDEDVLIGKYLDTTGAEVINAGFGETGFIPCEMYHSWTFAANGALLSSSRIVCWYDSNKDFLSGGSKNMPTIYLSDPSAAYFRILFSLTEKDTFMIVKDNTTLQPYFPYMTKGFIESTDDRLDELDGLYDDLQGVAFGTSITQRANTTGGYLQYLPSLAGMTFDNQGIGSSKIHGNMLTAIKSYAGYSDKNVCILEGFVNDWYNGEPLGTYTDSTEDTVCGCVRSALNYMLSQNANMTMFLILDHYGRYASGVHCESTALNPNNITQYAYYEEIAKVAESLGIPVIKMYAKSQMSENTPQYFIDNIHPNALGAKQDAYTIWGKMRAYFPNQQ